jgi:hypothetical protein
LAISASTAASRSPAIIASIIARDEPLSTLDATEVIDASVLEQLLQALDLPAPDVDLRLAVAGELTELPDRWRWHKARAHHPVRDDVSQPLRVGHVGLPPRDVLHVVGVAQPHLIEEPLERVEDRLPVNAGRLHRHCGHTPLGQPLRQGTQLCTGRAEAQPVCNRSPARSRHAGARRDRVAVHIKTCHPLPELLHPNLLLDAQ